MREFGWTPVAGQHVLERDGYLAGPDAHRLHDLNSALRDDTIDAIWCIRGGYGMMRILDHIDYGVICEQPKPIIGFSDITALHAAVGRRCSIISYHGPTARAEMSPFSRNSFERAVVFNEDPLGVAHGARMLYPGRAQGRLMGGNLALLAALAGTPYFPDLQGAVLVLEDVNETAYRIDRLLHQLLLSGALSHVAALAFGQFTECDESPDRLFQEFADRLKVPCLANLPIGHVDDQWTVPLGALATLDADEMTLTLIPHH